MIVVEFVGLPGVGKTTLCRRLCSISDELQDVHKNKTYFEFNWRVALTRHFHALSCLFIHPLISAGLFEFICKSRQRSINDFRAVYVNTLYKLQLYKKFESVKINVLDEGILHSLFSILMSSENDDLDYSEFVSLLKINPNFKWIVVNIKGNNIDVVEQFKNRSESSSKSHRIESVRFAKKIDLHKDKYFDFIESLNSKKKMFTYFEVNDSSDKSALDLYRFISSKLESENELI